MAPPVTLFRFRLTTHLSQDKIDIRVAMHPSETRIFMITRVLAFALNFQDGIEFGAGLSDPDAPAIRVNGTRGEVALWIDIGNPSARRIHKSAKAASLVKIYTYKDVALLQAEVKGEKIYNAHKIEVFALDSDFLEILSELLERDNEWEIKFSNEELQVTVNEEIYSGSLKGIRLLM